MKFLLNALLFILFLFFPFNLLTLAQVKTPYKASDKTENTKTFDDPGFDAVMAQLEMDGDALLYMGPTETIQAITEMVENTMPALRQFQSPEMEAMLNVAETAINKSGLKDLLGIGYSTVNESRSFHRSTWFLHHAPGKEDGLIWQLYPKAENKLEGLTIFPKTTALMTYGDLDIAAAWNWINELGKDNPLGDIVSEMKEDIAEELDIDRAIAALDGDWGYAITLDSRNKIESPLGRIPAPGLVYIATMNDSYPYDKLLAYIREESPEVEEKKHGEVTYTTVPMQEEDLPYPILPCFAFSDGQAIFTSTDTLMENILDAQRGEGDSLVKQSHFRRLATRETFFSNQITYISPPAGRILKQAVKMIEKQDPSAAPMIDFLLPKTTQPLHLLTNIQRIDGGLRGITRSNAKGMLRLHGGPTGPTGVFDALSAGAIPLMLFGRTGEMIKEPDFGL